MDTINRLIWKMPYFIHATIAKLFDLELIEVVDVSAENVINHPDGSVEYQNCSITNNAFVWAKVKHHNCCVNWKIEHGKCE